MPLFGQVVIGPPGAGKSTYISAVQQLLAAQNRPVACINLDPANDNTPYPCTIDIRDVVDVEDVMKHMKLGPNGGLVFAMEYMESKLDWLSTKLTELETENRRTYLLIDLPGQVELFTHHSSVKNILSKLMKWGHGLVAVNLVDSHYCIDPSKFISVLLSTLATLVNLEMPQINLLSKIDLLTSYGALPLPLDFFTDVMDMRYLLQLLPDDEFTRRHNGLSKAITELVEDYNLVTFQPCNIHDGQSMSATLSLCDKATGYIYKETDAPDLRKIHSKNNQNDDFIEHVMDNQ